MKPTRPPEPVAVESESARRRVVAGFGVVVGLGGLLAVSGVDWTGITTAVGGADPATLGVAFGAALLAQLAWASTTATFLRSVGDAPTRRVQLGYLAGTFAKQVLPFGHAGGAPLLSYVFSRDLDIEYRRLFPAVTASELVVFLASVAVAVVGAVWFGLTGGLAAVAPSLGREAATAVVGGVALSALGLAAAAQGATRRRAVLRRVALLFAAVGRATLARPVPSLRRRLDPDTVGRGVDGFADAFSRATADRRAVVRAAGFALAGWFVWALPLYFAVRAVGAELPLAVAFLLVPAAGLAGLLPTPGGLGGAEVGLTAGVVLLAGVGVDVAAAGVLLYRVCSYWGVVAVGGAASLYLSTGRSRGRRRVVAGDDT
ncbi:YbhN family protein [Halobium salinum]|uniref:YbhN family protein n=1 Tax=Halobium salinum TaxID=1364940 RepID=A0ABD5PAS8_9EURY|nr:flippase-like domain-containing protein [Halobium salinum]